MSRKSPRDILKEREERYRVMARAAERSAATSQDSYVRTVYFSLAEGWLGFADKIAAELQANASEQKDHRTKSYKSDLSVGGIA